MTCFLTALLPAGTEALELCGKPAQGEILKGYAPGAEKILLDGREYMLSPSGNFLLAFGRDETPEKKLTVINAKGAAKDYSLNVAATKWDIQDIKGIPQKKVTPSAADQNEIGRERGDLKKALADKLNKNYWEKGFVMPVKGRISGHFGGQRIMNGRKMNPHQGTDIAAPEGTPVKAASNGIIRLSGGNYFYSGNTVVIDHGHQLFTIYAHLKKVSVKAGDYVRQGQVIGEVGKTGRVTGPHLHWVNIGFVNALGIMIFTSQLGNFEGEGWQMYALVALGIAIIYLFPRVTKAIPSTLVAVVVVTAIAIFGDAPVRTIGDIGNITAALPAFHIPAVPLNMETLMIILPYSFSLALVGLVETLLTSKVRATVAINFFSSYPSKHH